MHLINKLKIKALAGIAVAAMICLAASTLHAATINVDTTADEITANGQCSLREAIRNANAGAQLHADCTGGVIGLDIINLGSETYALTRIGSCEDGCFEGDLDIGDPNQTDVQFTDLTIRGGKNPAPACAAGLNNGGGIMIQQGAYSANASLERVVVDSNSATENGGGIYNTGSNLSITYSTISGNTCSGSGGGIANFGSGVLINSTVSGNVSEGGGGGIYCCSNMQVQRYTDLRNVTISNNTTNAGDGGGLAVPCQMATARVRNTIIAGNTDNTAALSPDCIGLSAAEIDSEGYNLIGDNRGCVNGVNATWLGTDQIGDVAGGGTAIDPLLGGLADNGGTTPTQALDPLSLAVDKGNDVVGCMSGPRTVLNDDQRLELRPFDGDGDSVAVCDVGAYELQGFCGDGVIQSPDEECDDGANNSDTEPDACRTDCTLPICGDGVVDTGAGETCDDGNTVDGDGCSSSCVLETCGDGVVQAGEECDDGVDNSDTVADACRTTCLLPSCGDAVVDTGEQCDDGGNVDGDGCSSTCQTELVLLLGDGGCNLTAASSSSQHLGMMLMAGVLGSLALLRRRFF
jgi:CSLREA domain-containing protein